MRLAVLLLTLTACTQEDHRAIAHGLAQGVCASAGNCTCQECDNTGMQNER